MSYNDDAREPSSVTGRALGGLALVAGLGAGGYFGGKAVMKAGNKILNSKIAGEVASNLGEQAGKISNKMNKGLRESVEAGSKMKQAEQILSSYSPDIGGTLNPAVLKNKPRHDLDLPKSINMNGNAPMNKSL